MIRKNKLPERGLFLLTTALMLAVAASAYAQSGVAETYPGFCTELLENSPGKTNIGADFYPMEFDNWFPVPAQLSPDRIFVKSSVRTADNHPAALSYHPESSVLVPEVSVPCEGSPADLSPNAVPEPATMCLLGAGLLMLVKMRKIRRRPA
ncbi:MAG: hypothetical protein AMJ79_11720 [Phycisphaerae bacterium SM23_30]|nr:MAG: hypothetical protein AMJ79_11720 [Phycisphaerae bacterium SM23_30]